MFSLAISSFGVFILATLIRSVAGHISVVNGIKGVVAPLCLVTKLQGYYGRI